jgi:hypothetical protein
MGYTGKTSNVFSSCLSPDVRPAGMSAHGFGSRKGRIGHKASLHEFLIICNSLALLIFNLRVVRIVMAGLDPAIHEISSNQSKEAWSAMA